MSPVASSQEPQSDDTFSSSVIDLVSRVAISYFAIVAVAVLIDLVRGNRLTFVSWTSFALQSAAAFLLAAIVTQRTLARWQQAGRTVPPNISAAAAVIGLALAAGTLAGGFFPDGVTYRRRAPELFLRTTSALVPMVVAVYLVLRSAQRPGR
jgi:NAD/NADP transhydrogenase alpha subunit